MDIQAFKTDKDKKIHIICNYLTIKLNFDDQPIDLSNGKCVVNVSRIV